MLMLQMEVDKKVKGQSEEASSDEESSEEEDTPTNGKKTKDGMFVVFIFCPTPIHTPKLLFFDCNLHHLLPLRFCSLNKVTAGC